MRTLKRKTFVVVLVTAMFVFNCIFNSVLCGTPIPAANEKFQKDNAIIREDLEGIKYHKQHVKNLEEKYKKDKTAGRDEALILDQRDLMKAKADLSRHKD